MTQTGSGIVSNARTGSFISRWSWSAVFEWMLWPAANSQPGGQIKNGPRVLEKNAGNGRGNKRTCPYRIRAWNIRRRFRWWSLPHLSSSGLKPSPLYLIWWNHTAHRRSKKKRWWLWIGSDAAILQDSPNGSGIFKCCTLGIHIPTSYKYILIFLYNAINIALLLSFKFPFFWRKQLVSKKKPKWWPDHRIIYSFIQV